VAAVTEGVLRKSARSCAAVALGALVLRLALAARPAVVLDRLFIPDDTYYTLAIARSLARGLGPTVDGVHLTSGFQPLLAFLLVPVLRCSASPDLAFRSALAIGAIADAATAWLLGHLVRRVAPKSEHAPLVATVTWSLSSSAIATSLNGLETSLAVACTLGALSAWSAARSSPTSRAWAATGGLLGLCLLARVDTVFFVLVVGVATMLRAGIRATLTSVAGALAVVGPWWGYAFARFGTVIPESGAAVRERTLMYEAMGINVRDCVAWAAGAIVGPPLFDWKWLRWALGSGASAIGCGVGVALVVFALVVARQARRPDELRILLVNAACLFVFYALYLPATWFFRRYLVPVHAVTAVAWALVADRAYAERLTHLWRARAVMATSGCCLLAALVSLGRFSISEPEMTVDRGHHGAKGYAAPAQQILALAPPGAVIGSFQTGALGWFADGSGRTVVNLDGVVDGEAARAVREHRIAAFARARGVTHLADWDVNTALFLAPSGDQALRRDDLQPIGSAEPQGKAERFVLYAIRWP
jgi:hypothetical protein